MLKKFALAISLFFALCLPKQIIANEPGSTQVLVFGGTGRLGSDVVKALYREGFDITVFARATSNRARLQGLDVRYVIGDVLDAASIDSAISDHKFDVFVDALGRGTADVEFFRDSAKNIANSASGAGIKQIILHGSVGAGDSAKAYGSNSGSMGKLFVAKTAGENAVITSGVAYTIIRNSHLIRYGTAETGNAELYEDQMTTGSVTRLGLARLTAGCILNSVCMNKIYHAVDKSLDTH